MSTISDIRTALADRISTVEGLRVHDRAPGTSLVNETDAAVIGYAAGDFTTTFGGSSTSSPMSGELVVRLFVMSGNTEEAWAKLDEYLSPEGGKSIVNAVNRDQSLGLTDVTAAVIGFRDAGFREDLDGVPLSADLIIRYVKRT